MRMGAARYYALSLGVGILATAGAAQAATVRVVGPGHTYAKPCQAITAAQPGDTIQIDAAGNGTYDGDVCSWSTAGLSIEGINGRAKIAAAGQNSGGKGIWVTSGPDTVVSNVELSGAAVPDQNGAAIRVEGSGDLTLIGSYIHDNQEGILAGGSTTATDIVVDSSEFSHNGANDGLSHNIYVSAARSFTMRYSYSHDAVGGHLVKSRAFTNDILYNRLTGEAGTSAYELDLPNAGLSHVIGNVIEQGPATTNSSMLTYGEEGATNPSSHLDVINNTFVNDRSLGGTAVHVAPAVTSPALIEDNISIGSTTFVDQNTATLTANCTPADAKFVARATFDYHLQQGSPCIDFGVAPPSGLAPTQQYVYNAAHEGRSVVGLAPDAGAFESNPDSDGDGVPDSVDACPTVPGPVSNNGCPAVVVPPPDQTPPHDQECDSAQSALEKAKDKLKKLKKAKAPSRKLKKAEAKVKKDKAKVKDAC